MEADFALLYVSDLARGESYEAVLDIAEQSTRNNLRNGITGLLLFDGARFAQFVEGPEATIRDLCGRLRSDSRHESMDTLLFGQSIGARAFSVWQCVVLPERDALIGKIDQLRGTSGATAIGTFDELTSTLASAGYVSTRSRQRPGPHLSGLRPAPFGSGP